jgi:glycosyltransferase involved in cell wall biosynthesis
VTAIGDGVSLANNNENDSKMTAKVTIGLPTYNRANRFLVPALECALAQDWDNLEIIVSDNCSTDNTSEIMSSYADSRLRYVRQEENIGANNNFNFCVQEAQGAYFLLFPDDDVIDPDFVSSCMEAAAGRADYGVIRSGTRLIDGDGNLIREIPNRAGGLDYNAYFRAWMRGQFTSYVCSTLYNTQMLRDIGGFQSRHGLYQDLMALARLIARGGHCNVVEPKASFRRHDENYGNAEGLRAWCEDGVQLAEVIAAEAPVDGDALYRESMKYLCRTVYGYAQRFLPSRMERFKAYRMIDAEFDHSYPLGRYIYDTQIGLRYRRTRNSLRDITKSLLGSTTPDSL